MHLTRPENGQKSHTRVFFATQMSVVCFLPLCALQLQPVPSPPALKGPAFPLFKDPCAGKGWCLCSARTEKLTNFLFSLQ